MIYTSYFAKLRSMPENIVSISICAKVPVWYKGLQYKKLAPKYDFFMRWKENHDDEYYIKCFKEQVTDKLNAVQVIRDLNELVADLEPKDGSCDVVLVCYEKPSDFCHRHLVAKWLNENGFVCKEWGVDE